MLNKLFRFGGGGGAQKARLHTQGGDGADCILFLNGLHSLKFAA